MTNDPTDQCLALQQRLGITFHDCGLLVQALTHRSYLAEVPDAMSNERLEFLGDAVLDLVVAEELFKRHADWPEGELTKAKASAVDERALERLARDWELARMCWCRAARSRRAGASGVPCWRMRWKR